MKTANSTTKQSRVDALGIGSVVVDELLLLPAFPTPDSKTDALSFMRQVGGPVPTAIRTLAKLGQTTSFIGKIGQDPKASFIQDELAQSHVDYSGMIIENEAQTGFAQAWIDKNANTRTIVHCKGTISPFKLTDFDIEKMPPARLLHIDGREHSIIKKIISYYHHNNTLISIDTGSFRKKTLQLLPLADIIIMPIEFAVARFGDKPIAELLKKSCAELTPTQTIIITDGSNGSVCHHQGKNYQQPAFTINAQDTAGAGDVHAGGVLFGMLNKKPIQEVLKLGAATAALKCLKMGNKEALPTLASLEIFLKQNS